MVGRGGKHWTVSVYGTDDTNLVKFFDNADDALKLSNSLTYLQSHADLTMFEDKYSNGWPTKRKLFAGEFNFPEEQEDEQHWWTPVPWSD